MGVKMESVRRGRGGQAWEGIKYRRRRSAQPLLLLSPLWVGVLAELRGPEATPTTTAVGEEEGDDARPRAHHPSYMSSCPFADLVVAVLLAAAAVVLLHDLLAGGPRSMHQGLHGWNKSSSMLRDGFGVKYSGFLHIRPCSFLRGD